jgi:hypothetical protein
MKWLDEMVVDEMVPDEMVADEMVVDEMKKEFVRQSVHLSKMTSLLSDKLQY